MVYALGAQSLLVATDTTSLYPEAATRTPKVGYLRQLSAEGLLSLQPDALVGAADAGPAVVLEQVRAAGVRVELVPAQHSFEEVLRKVETVGRVTGREALAAQLAQRLQQEWAQVSGQVAQATRRPRALFILSHNGSPMVAGTDTAAHALLTLAGADNVVTAFAGYRPLTAEAMAAAAPRPTTCTGRASACSKARPIEAPKPGAGPRRAQPPGVSTADSSLKCNTCHRVRFANAKHPLQALSTAPARRPRDAGQPAPAKVQRSRHRPRPWPIAQHH